MKYRPLGRTGLSVSELTLGARGLDGQAWKDLDLAEADAAMALAFKSGINAVETAGLDDEARAWIGQAVKRHGPRDGVHVLSQVSPLVPLDLPAPHYHANDIYPGSHIRASTEAALKAFGVERLGLQQLPVWAPEWSWEGDWRETLTRLRDEGKIAGFGVSLFDHDPTAALDLAAKGAIDCVQVMFNLFDQGAADALLSLCWKNDVGVIARSPLYAGALTARIEEDAPFAPGDWRYDYFYPEHLAETRERAARLTELVAAPDKTLSDMALRFSLSDPAISTVAVGMRTRAHVEANLRAVEHGPLNAQMLRRLGEHKWLC